MPDLFDQMFSLVVNEANRLPSRQKVEKNNLSMENLLLRNTRLKQEISGDALDKRLKLEKAQWQRHIDDVKLTFGIYEKAFSNPAMSEASRENMLELAGMLKNSLSPMERVALAGIGSTRILSADEQRAQEFDRRFPAESPPLGDKFQPLEHTAENAGTWASYYIRSAERARKRAIAVYGVDKGKVLVPLPSLFETDEKGLFAFRNPLTRRIGFLDAKTDLPEGLLKRSIDEKRTSLPEFARTGMIPDPDQKPRIVNFNGSSYSLEAAYDARTAKYGLKSTPLGPAPPKDLPVTLRNVMFAFGIKDEGTRNKILKNPAERGLYNSLSQVMSMKDASPERKAAMNSIRAKIRQAWPQDGWLPFISQEPKEGFFNFMLPKSLDSFSMENTGIIWRRVVGVEKFVDAHNQVFTAYRAKSGNLVDANGKDIPDSKDKKPGEVLPHVVVKPKAIAPGRNMTLGEVISQGVPLNPKGAERVVEAYAKSARKHGEVIDKESFKSFLLNLTAGAHTLSDMFYYKPLQAILNMPIPGTEIKK